MTTPTTDAPDVAEIAAGLSDGQRADLTSNWNAACDADWELVTTASAYFWDRQEAAGFAALVPVDDDALQDPFAWERGIDRGGSMWKLTALGMALRTHLEKQNG